ncbi:unnamed protein product [Amoebophrya sp. A120]|nr:unnamed protein product [Amoebophrya sp. A120]|eukprot:GSA120T00024799001.1
MTITCHARGELYWCGRQLPGSRRDVLEKVEDLHLLLLGQQ